MLTAISGILFGISSGILSSSAFSGTLPSIYFYSLFGTGSGGLSVIQSDDLSGNQLCSSSGAPSSAQNGVQHGRGQQKPDCAKPTVLLGPSCGSIFAFTDSLDCIMKEGLDIMAKVMAHKEVSEKALAFRNRNDSDVYTGAFLKKVRRHWPTVVLWNSIGPGAQQA